MTDTPEQTPEPEFCYRKTHNEERRDCGCAACIASLEADNAE